MAAQDIVKGMFSVNPIISIDRRTDSWSMVVGMSGRTWIGICAVILSITSPPVIQAGIELLKIIIS